MLGALLSATRGNWGPRPQIAHWIYTAMVRPSVTYAALVWAHDVTLVQTRELLLRLDRMASLAIAAVKTSTPSRGLSVVLGITPLHLHSAAVALATVARYPSLRYLPWNGLANTTRHSVSHRLHWNSLLNDSNIPPETDRLRTTAPLSTYRVIRDSFTGGSKYKQFSQINVYTDGSRSDHGVGSGFTIYEGSSLFFESSHSLPPSATVFQAELSAIFLAAEHILSEIRTLRPRYIKIFIDSRSALQALDSRRVKSSLVLQTMNKLNELATTARSVRLVWTKAHSGVRGNEAADLLAKKGADPLSASPPHAVLPAFGVARRAVASLCLSLWTKEWAAYLEDG